MTPIESIRELRASDSFEPVMSHLFAAIGKCERLPPLEPDQLDRLSDAVRRLSNEERKRSRG